MKNFSENISGVKNFYSTTIEIPNIEVFMVIFGGL